MQDKIIEWNNYHLDILSSDKPKCITKIGSTEAVHIAEYIKTNGQNCIFNSHDLNMACGIYRSSLESHKKWCEAYINGIKTSDYLHLSHEIHFKRNENTQKRILNQHTDTFIYNSLKDHMNLSHIPESCVHHSIYSFLLKEKSWHYNLQDKKVLVVSSSQKTFEHQAERFSNIWPGAKLGGFEFVKIPSSEYLTHDDQSNQIEWSDKVENAKNEIRKKDFDFAMLGCGGIGLILVDFIKNEIGKSCTYLGGSLQLYFGIRGGRWENLKNNWYNANEFWTKPFKEDIPKNYKINEGGCYWVQ